jgi:hypothetical protein
MAMCGTIYSGTYLNGVALTNPATQNPATVTATGYITNSGSNSVALLGEPGFAWTLDNYGRIVGHGPGGLGVELASGGTQSEIPG